MVTTWQIITVLFVHWLGDFVFQSDWMAQNKSKSNRALLIHIGTYTVPLAFGGVLLAFLNQVEMPLLGGLVFAVVNGLAHFITDWFTSRINSKLWAEKRVHAFFVSVGFDQFLHAAVLLLTLPLLTRP